MSHRTRRVGVEPCSIEGCDALIKARGWCVRHWTLWQRHGTPTPRLRGVVVDGRRVCPRCGEDKPLGAFTRNKVGRCKRCGADRQAERRALGLVPSYRYPPEVERAKARSWRRANPEKVRAQAATYRARKVAQTVEHFLPSEVFDRDEWICALCGARIDRMARYPDPMSVSLDHITPLSHGGAHSRDNTQATHLICNVRKSNRADLRA